MLLAIKAMDYTTVGVRLPPTVTVPPGWSSAADPLRTSRLGP